VLLILVWIITITQKNTTQITIKINGSNMKYIGGMWQTNINGQDYLKFSIEFVAANDSVIQEIGLPYGQPMGIFCAPESVIDKAFTYPNTASQHRVDKISSGVLLTFREATSNGGLCTWRFCSPSPVDEQVCHSVAQRG